MLQTNTTFAVMSFSRNIPGSVVVELSLVSALLWAKLRAMHPVALSKCLAGQWSSDRAGDRASQGPRRFLNRPTLQGRQGQDRVGY